MSKENNERNILARMRTLLALERNYLAEERTQLAKLRTGLALVLILPPFSLFTISVEIEIPLVFLIIFYIFLILNAIYGGWMVFGSRSQLKKLRKKIKLVKKKEKQIFDSSKAISELFTGCIKFDDEL
ncbi:MAG: hypothetical protein ACTSUT_20700 [Promethearchaeota archaeon]